MKKYIPLFIDILFGKYVNDERNKVALDKLSIYFSLTSEDYILFTGENIGYGKIEHLQEFLKSNLPRIKGWMIPKLWDELSGLIIEDFEKYSRKNENH